MPLTGSELEVPLYIRLANGTIYRAGITSAGGGAPSGAAGGALTGTYPNPTIAAGIIVDADVNASAAIAQSKIANLTTDLAAKVPTTRSVIAGNGLTGGGALSADATLNVVAGDTTLSVAADSITVASAPRWTNGITLTLTGDVTGASSSFTGASNVSFATAIGSGVIVDADVNASAAIAQSKISGLTTSLSGKVDTTRSVIAGAGLTGGGALSADATLNVVSATTDMTVGTDSITINSAPKWSTARTLTVSGDITGSVSFDGSAAIALNNTAIGAGVIVDNDVNASAAIAQSKISGLTTSLSGKAATTTTVTAGAGLTGGGDLSANRTLDVGQGTGILVSADAVAVDTAVIATKTLADSKWTMWTGTQAAYDAIGTKDSGTLYVIV